MRGHLERQLSAKKWHIQGMLSLSICNLLLQRQYSTVVVSPHLSLISGY